MNAGPSRRAAGAASHTHTRRPAGPPRGRRPRRRHRSPPPCCSSGRRRRRPPSGSSRRWRAPTRPPSRARASPSPSTPPATSTRESSCACAAATARCASPGPPTADPLIRDNAELFRVFYVKVTTPTTKLGSRRGWYPDPLVPREFGAIQSVPGSVNPGPTTPFYILVHVPLGTPRGHVRRHAARGERRRGEGRAVQPARVELRLEQDQHALGLRHEPGQPRAQPAAQLQLRRRRTRPRCCATSTR